MAKLLKFLSAKIKGNRGIDSAQKPTPDVVSTTLDIPTSASSLLHEVLSGSLHDRGQYPTQDQKKSSETSLSEKLNIGVRLGQAKQTILEQVAKLSSTSDQRTAEALSDIIVPLQKQVCRIAFVGQMKAGKSSLINALVEDAELLPADINPWTTVVTHLQFGVPGKPVSGASFTFFSADEWQRLSMGGRVRELTEQLFPDLDWAVLRDQIHAMRQRAELKLGPSFEDLLGTEHNYPFLTPGLLNRYVGAGAPEGAEPTLPEGEFSDITKAANVFFDPGVFNFPTILIDTPGVNDPFLVRDEITRQTLEFADVSIIVLTARQLLSSADLNLLRMLRGLKKSRLIIFVNKIDELEADATTLKQINSRIGAVLKEEFPSNYIPIVLGSALWAKTAVLETQTSHSTLLIEDESNLDSDNFWPGSSDIVQNVAWDARFTKSGLPKLALAISELMRDGAIAENINQTAFLLQAICFNVAACLSVEIDVLETFICAPDKAANKLMLLTNLCASLSGLAEEAGTGFTQFIATETQLLHGRLLDTVRNHSVSLLADLVTSSADFSKAAVADLNLRLRLETAFLADFAQASAALQNKQRTFHEEVRSLLERCDFHGELKIPSSEKIAEHEAPSLAALSDPVSIGLATSSAQFALKRMQPAELRMLMSKVIEADFRPIIDKLAAEAEATLNSMCYALLDRTRLLTLHQVQMICSRLTDTLSDLNKLIAREQDSQVKTEKLIDVAIERRNEEITVLHEISSSLSSAIMEKP